MDIEEHIKINVIEESHLADLLLGSAEYAEEMTHYAEAIRMRVVELLEQGLIELYTYLDEPQRISTLDRETAVAIARDSKNWAWQSPSGRSQCYFVCTANLADGRPPYGFD